MEINCLGYFYDALPVLVNWPENLLNSYRYGLCRLYMCSGERLHLTKEHVCLDSRNKSGEETEQQILEMEISYGCFLSKQN